MESLPNPLHGISVPRRIVTYGPHSFDNRLHDQQTVKRIGVVAREVSDADRMKKSYRQKVNPWLSSTALKDSSNGAFSASFPKLDLIAISQMVAALQ